MSFSEKIYRFLLRAYPSEYRTRYAEPMEQLFRDRLRDAHAFAEWVELWLRMLTDWAISVPARHWERIRPPNRAGWQQSARRCLFFSRHEASSFSRREITVEHLLLGLLREEQSLVSREGAQVIVRAIEANEPTGRRVPPTEDLRLSPESMHVVAAAAKIARSAGRGVSPADLAAAILGRTNTLASRLLREHTADR